MDLEIVLTPGLGNATYLLASDGEAVVVDPPRDAWRVSAVADLCSTAATLLILVALAGVGISTDVRAMIGVGAGPFLLGAAMWIVMGLLALGLATVVAGSAGSGAAGPTESAVYHGG